jgi:hypothetical protein
MGFEAERGAIAACLLAALSVVAPAGSAAAGRIVIERLGATSQGYPYIDYTFADPFTGKALDAIRSGLPSTLTFTLEVWRKRPGWWDGLEETRESRLRILRDLINQQYVVVTPDEIRRYADMDSLVAGVCNHRRTYLRPLHPQRTYYVVVSANLASLSVEDMRELEQWLRGTIQSGDESSPGRVAGISGTMVGLLMSVTGFGDETTRGRSANFQPGKLPRTAPDPGAEPAPLPTAADSGRTRAPRGSSPRSSRPPDHRPRRALAAVRHRQSRRCRRRRPHDG